MTKLACLIVLALASTAHAEKYISAAGRCLAILPDNWSSSAQNVGQSSDKKVSLTISFPRDVDSFGQLKHKARTLHKHAKVTEDTDLHFELEGSSPDGKPIVYLAISDGKMFCEAEVIYEAGTVEEARALARLVKIIVL